MNNEELLKITSEMYEITRNTKIKEDEIILHKKEIARLEQCIDSAMNKVESNRVELFKLMDTLKERAYG